MGSRRGVMGSWVGYEAALGYLQEKSSSSPVVPGAGFTSGGAEDFCQSCGPENIYSYYS